MPAHERAHILADLLADWLAALVAAARADTSKSTGDTYPGGRVERELEEVCETCDDFLSLVRGRAITVRKGA